MGLHIRMASLCLVALLAACAPMAKQQQATRAKSELVGMNQSQILSCMGVPASQAKTDDIEAWQYHTTGPTTYQSNGLISAYGNNANTALTTYRKDRDCTVDVIFQGGNVTRINYSGESGGIAAPEWVCASLIANCVKP